MKFQTERIDAPMKHALLFLFILSLGGCSRAPAVDILGSFFPAWLLCFTVAVILAALVQLLLSRLRLSVAYPILFFPSLATILTLVLWLIFFR